MMMMMVNFLSKGNLQCVGADGMMAAAAGEGGLRSPHHLHRHPCPRPCPRHHGSY